MGTLSLKTLATLFMHLRVSRFIECSAAVNTPRLQEEKVSLRGPHVARCVMLYLGLRMFLRCCCHGVGLSHCGGMLMP